MAVANERIHGNSVDQCQRLDSKLQSTRTTERSAFISAEHTGLSTAFVRSGRFEKGMISTDLEDHVVKYDSSVNSCMNDSPKEMSSIEKSTYRSSVSNAFPSKDSPSSLNTTVIADAILSLNKMVDNYMNTMEKGSTNEALYNYIMQPDPQSSAATAQRVEQEDNALKMRREYLKGWISRCKVASKGMKSY
jgi:hypothetical protein